MLRSIRSTAASSQRLSAVTRAASSFGAPPPPPSSHCQPSRSFHVAAQERQFLPRFYPITSPMVSACFSTEAALEPVVAPTEIVVELYEKMRKSVDETRSMPANVNMWALVDNCNNREDIKLMFQILQKLRIFRLSNLRIHDNFNYHLCWRISKACVRANAIDYGLKALWKHNVYGLTPSIGSAHCFLLHAKEKNNMKLMARIMQVMSKNSLPLQAGTADIVFSICYNSNDWALLSKYARKFLKAKVKLRRNAFGIWMDFAAKNGDVESIWKIEKLRSKTVNKHTVASVFSCAKGYLLEHNPESAAAIINLFYQGLPDEKKQSVTDELQKLLVGDWVKKVSKRLKKEDTEELAESLRSDITVMATSLLNMGLDAKMNLEEINANRSNEVLH